jgi:hypothetical protein
MDLVKKKQATDSLHFYHVVNMDLVKCIQITGHGLFLVNIILRTFASNEGNWNRFLINTTLIIRNYKLDIIQIQLFSQRFVLV